MYCNCALRIYRYLLLKADDALRLDVEVCCCHFRDLLRRLEADRSEPVASDGPAGRRAAAAGPAGGQRGQAQCRAGPIEKLNRRT